MIGDATGRLAHQTRQLCDLIEEKGALWDDEGGRTTLHAYLRPHAEAAKDLVAALHERDELLEAFEAEMAIVERELEVAAAAHRATEAAVARATEDVRWADDRVAEILKEEAEVAELEATAVRYADLANGYARGRGPVPILLQLDVETWRTARRRAKERQHVQRLVRLSELQAMFPSLGVWHVLEGEFNALGRFTGFHSRLSNVGNVLAEEEADKTGVYRAFVAGRRSDETLVLKQALKHTMFPACWSEERICCEVLGAHEALPEGKKTAKTWRSISPSGVPILGHVRKDGSIIGYPLKKEEARAG